MERWVGWSHPEMGHILYVELGMVVVPLVVDLALESSMLTGGWAVSGLPWLPMVLVAPALTSIPISTGILLLPAHLIPWGVHGESAGQ